MRVPRSWDVFCRVVDNFGDAGVCWRLARQLACEQQARVRLWVDGIESLALLVPGVADGRTIDGVAIRAWPAEFAPVAPSEVTVEAFGCGLPERHVERMAGSTRASLWIVLEHLSAETWVVGCHGLPSPHPRWPIARYFFFPGFTPGTGGVLRERDLLARRDAFIPVHQSFWRAAGHDPPPPHAMTVSLFAYDTAPLDALLDVWCRGDRLTVAVLPGTMVGRVGSWARSAASAPAVVRRGALELRMLRFLPQRTYDELLWSCDVNFVRGEDSFVRAQWAARPFVWNVYPQHSEGHRAKLDAFLTLYCRALAAPAADAAAGMMRVWNDVDPAPTVLQRAWQCFVDQRQALVDHARGWTETLGRPGDLAENLASFCRAKLK